MFVKKSLLPISVAIISQAITTKMDILDNLTIMAWPNMVTDLVKSDFFANIRMNKDH